jgi:hypothetical protein
MGSLGRPEDSRLSRLPHVRGLSLASKQQRVRVSICAAGDDPADEAENADEEHSGIHVPALEQVGDGAVQLLQETRHVGSKYRSELLVGRGGEQSRAEQSRATTAVAAILRQ